MRLWIGSVALMLSSLAIGEEACFPKVNNKQFGAKFSVWNSEHTNEIEQWNYWRMDNQVAYEYSQGISDVWTLENSKQLNLLRVFDQYGKGIAYTATDLKLIGRHENWKGISKIIQVPENIERIGIANYHCQTVSVYEFKLGEGVLKLQWLDQINIPANVIYETKDYSSEIILTALIDAEESKKYFQTVQDFIMTDYSDIGDNESDPFLNQMINLGFIEPSGSLSNNQNEGHVHSH